MLNCMSINFDTLLGSFYVRKQEQRNNKDDTNLCLVFYVSVFLHRMNLIMCQNAHAVQHQCSACIIIFKKLMTSVQMINKVYMQVYFWLTITHHYKVNKCTCMR